MWWGKRQKTPASKIKKYIYNPTKANVHSYIRSDKKKKNRIWDF